LAAPVYPDLATEAGFFILGAALLRNSTSYRVSGWVGDDGRKRYRALIFQHGQVGETERCADTAPLALAMAAAAALGIEVQP
jgi:hypothetical protein